MKVSPFAGKAPEPKILVNVPRLVTAYYTEVPEPAAPTQHVAFGTSGHRASSLQKAFNEWHVLAIGGNAAPIGGLKVVAESGWFAAHPSWTEDIYKIYA